MPRCSLKINSIQSNIGPKCTVQTIFLNQPVKFLLDSGSQVNTIPQMYIPEEIMKNLKPSPYNLSGYSNSEINVFGIFETDIKINHIQIEKITFFVVDNNRTPVLGTPVFSQENITMNLFKKELSINNEKVTLDINFISTTFSPSIKCIQKPKLKSIYAFAPENIILKPRHEITIQAYTNEYYTSNEYFLPEKYDSKENFAIKESVSLIAKNSFPLTLSNHTTKQIKISKNTKIAVLHHIDNLVEINQTQKWNRNLRRL